MLGNQFSRGCLFLRKCTDWAHTTIFCANKFTHTKGILRDLHTVVFIILQRNGINRQKSIAFSIKTHHCFLSFYARCLIYSNIIKVILNPFHELVMAATSQLRGLIHIYALPWHAGGRETRPKVNRRLVPLLRQRQLPAPLLSQSRLTASFPTAP